MSLSSPYQQKAIENFQNFLAKDLKDRHSGKNIKQKVRIKTKQASLDISMNQNLQKFTYCLFQIIQTKIIIQKGIKLQGNIYQKALINRKGFP